MEAKIIGERREVEFFESVPDIVVRLSNDCDSCVKEAHEVS